MTSLAVLIGIAVGLDFVAVSQDPTAMLLWVDALRWMARSLEIRAKAKMAGRIAFHAMREIYRRDL